MKLTALSCQEHLEEDPVLSCHLLEICQTRVLLECPLDLSVLAIFLPSFESVQDEGKQKHKSHTDVMSASLSFLKENSGQVLIEGEPWYKTAELGLVEVALLDAVVVSNPLGLLGLPFLTKNPDFSAKIYMTEATAKIGQLMMEELVNMHAECIQVHGRSRDGQLPSWLNISTLDTLPAILRDSIVGRSLAGRANWHLLYNKADIRDCMAMVHRLHYGEEANIDGCLKIKPSSSGLGIGASNWTLSGARRSVAYIAGSLVTANSVKAFDLPALEGSQILLFGDVEFADESSTSVEEKVTSVSPVGAPTLSSERGGNRGSGEVSGALRPDTTASEVRPQVAAVCKAAVETVRRGGSVLIPSSPFPILLELLDEMAVQLASVNLTDIPMKYISPAAEEMLAYGNTVPEWLCPSRQEKLYAGEPLFGYVDLMREEHLCGFKALHSPDLQTVWQEPCIIFASHWSLRMGPAVHLLHRWRHNPLCLLILIEQSLDVDLILAPFKPLAIQVLELPVQSRLSPKEVISVIQKVQPQLTLVPEFLLHKKLEATESNHLLSYRKGCTVRVPHFENQLEVQMSAELALQVQPKPVKPSKVAAALLHADLWSRDGIWSLQPASMAKCSGDLLPGLQSFQYRWGQVNVTALLTALKDRGLFDIHIQETASEEVGNEHFTTGDLKLEVETAVVEIRSPSQAWIEIRPNSSHIKADDPSLRHLIAAAVHSVLNSL
ncbi:unnamed protein product [Sphagnum jensenii]|uniref:Beta-Casp domain-containing protein n=1 Tax=Sphagnum jensenii TaxID=128206 RepID=A0ABP1ACA1_9BRYO